MKAAFLLPAALLASTSAAFAAPTPAPVEAPAAPAPATPDQIAESALALRGADTQRILTDAAYAAMILVHLDRLAPSLSVDPEAALAIDNLRLVALSRLDRRAEAELVIDSILARRPTDPGHYAGPWIAAALSFDDKARVLATVETATRNVPGIGWADLRNLLDRTQVMHVLQQFQAANDGASRVRLAEALFRIGWPGDDPELSDSIRSILLEDRLASGDAAGASGFAAAITTPTNVLPLLVRKIYDPALAPGGDRLALLRRSLDLRDRETLEALTAAPRDMRRLLARAQYLRGLGRDADALALIEPFIRDVPATAGEGEFGVWLVNEAAFALIALDRDDEAVRLMDRLAQLPLDDNPNLINARINHLEILWSAGRYAEALERTVRVEADGARFASDYGKAWIASSRVCALASLDRAGEAAPQLERLRGWGTVNPSALTRAYLCLNDLDRAAGLLVTRLEGSEPETAILALQDYSLSRGSAQTGPLHSRFLSLRERPAVRAALDRVGRVLTLPLARTYWGNF